MSYVSVALFIINQTKITAEVKYSKLYLNRKRWRDFTDTFSTNSNMVQGTINFETFSLTGKIPIAVI